MPKPIIAIDIDDVLSESAEGFVAYSNMHYATSLSVTDYSEHWAEMWGVDHDEVHNRAIHFYASETISQYDRKVGSQNALLALAAEYELIAITSRQSKSTVQTNAWLAEHYPGVFDSVHFAGIYDDKIHASMLAQTKGALFASNQVTYVIDDQLKHCLAAVELGIDTILFGNYPWNQAKELPPLVTRCNDWQAVVEYFDGRS